MPVKNITRKDVARLANVSETTVSVVINNRTDIALSADTRQRVLDAVRELGYHPNHAARTMAGKKAYTLGVLSPWDLNTWFFADMLNGIRHTASRRGYGVMLCNILEQGDRPEDCIRFFQEGRIDGIVYLENVTLDLAEFDEIRREGIPTVLCNGINPQQDTDQVLIQYASGIRHCSHHLHQLGFAHQLYILPDEPQRLCAFDRERLNGFNDSCQKHHIQAVYEVFDLDGSKPQQMETARRILKKHGHPLGIVTCYWAQAHYLQLAALEAGLSLEQDIHVIAGDHPVFAQALYPEIHGVLLPFFKLGELSADLLINQLQQPQKPVERLEVPCQYSFSMEV